MAQGVGGLEREMSHLDYMHLWMHSIHAHTAQNTRASVDNTTLSPPIFIVGTHRDSLDPDPAIRTKLVSGSRHILLGGRGRTGDGL